jgi:AraC-like DNA-binding protein
LTINFDRIETANLVLSNLRFDRTSTLRTVAAPGWCTFGLARSAQRWCGIDVQPNTFFAIAPQEEVHVVSRESFDSVRITVRREVLASWEAPLAAFIGWPRAPEESIVVTDQDAVMRFSTWAQDVLGASMLPSSGDDMVLWASAIEARLRKHLMDIVGRRCMLAPASPMHRVARYDLALAALRSMRPDAQHRTRVADLAAALGVSQRALEYAFATVIGISPGQYILAERLNRARHHLIVEAAGGASVTAIAFGHQFDNLSRFAQQYTRLFGERPSDTLRAARAAFRRA